MNDDARALGYARRAYALKPGTPWVLDTMISLHSRAGDWREAQRLVEESQKIKRKSGSSGNRHQAALLTERARVARTAGQLADAYSQARKANDLDPHLVPAAELVARMVAEDGRARRARKVLERSWTVAPHPMLMDAYLEFGVGSKAPLERFKAVERIVKTGFRTRRKPTGAGRGGAECKTLGGGACAARGAGTDTPQFAGFSPSRPSGRGGCRGSHNPRDVAGARCDGRLRSALGLRGLRDGGG